MIANKTVFFILGILLIVLGISMLAPYSMQLIYNENSHSFVSSAFITIFIGILFILANLEKEFKLNLRQTFLFSTLAWVMVAFFGSLPFVLSPKEFSFSEAFFESMSGITTTGATIITDLDKSPKAYFVVESNNAMAWWNRNSSNGYYSIAVIKSWRYAIIQNGRSRQYGKDLPRTIEVATISTYFALTILWIFLLVIRMSVFDSISHAMTTIATGGFSTHNSSIGFFKNSNIEIIASIFIILGSIPFYYIFKILTRK